MGDLKARLANKVQLTTDGHKAYLTVVNEVDLDADYAMLIKLFATDIAPGPGRYSPPRCIGTQTEVIKDNLIRASSTRHLPSARTSLYGWPCVALRASPMRSQRSLRTTVTRCRSTSIGNWCRVHKTLGATPAMAAGLVDRIMKMDDIFAVLDVEQAPKVRGSYKNRGDELQISN